MQLGASLCLVKYGQSAIENEEASEEAALNDKAIISQLLYILLLFAANTIICCKGSSKRSWQTYFFLLLLSALRFVQICLVLGVVNFFCDNYYLMVLLICSFHRFQPLYRKNKHWNFLLSQCLLYFTGYFFLASLSAVYFEMGLVMAAASLTFAVLSYLHFITSRKIIRLRQMTLI